MDFHTADLCDAHEDKVLVLEPILRRYGGRRAIGGEITTLRLFEDNSLLRAALEQPGNGRVLVVDGGGSRRCALVGDQLALLAVKNGWGGIVVWGCIRDSAAIAGMELAVFALATHPRKSVKKNQGERDVAVSFGGLTFTPGHYLYADDDGVIVAGEKLL